MTDFVAETVVRRVLVDLGMAPVTMSVVPAGASNVVFEVVTTDGRRLAARASAQGTHRYLVEQAAMDRARAVGVPCPEVVEVTSVDGVGVMLCEWLPGQRMADAATAPDPHPAAWAANCGEILARIHSLPVQGYGNLDEHGNGARPTLDQWFVDDLRPRVESAAARCRDADTVADLERVYRVLDANRAVLRDAPPHLTHGDFSPMNLLVTGDRVTGVVDWESVKGGPAAFDFGWWDWFSSVWGTPFSTEAMVDAYSVNVDVDVAQLTELRRLVVLRILVGHLAWAAERNDAAATATAAARLRQSRFV